MNSPDNGGSPGSDSSLALFVLTAAGCSLRARPSLRRRHESEGPAGEPLTRFMVRQVFEPLAMERTVVAETDGLGGVASFYGPRMAMRTGLGLEAASRPEYSCLAGAGAFLSTPSDLVRLGSAMLKPSPKAGSSPA